MWLKKYRVVIKIEAKAFDLQVTTYLTKQFIFGQEICLETGDENRQLELAINHLLKIVYHHLPNAKPNHFIFEIHINSFNVQHKILQLPATKLLASEIPLFVEASINKLFQRSVHDIAFDYIHHIKDKNQLHVFVCNRNYLNQWIELLSKLQLSVNFIGLTTDNLTTINFLPWRLLKQKREKKGLAFGIITYSFLSILSLGYLWYRADRDLHQYIQLLADSQTVEQRLTQEISQKPVYYSKSQQQLLPFLLMLSKKIPPYIAVDSLEYEPLKINLVGNGLSYLAITQFSNLLNQEDLIQKSKIKTVTVDQNKLAFQMDISC